MVHAEALLDSIVEFVKAYLVPGSFPFLLIAVSVGIPGLFLDARWRRRSRTWLTGVVLVYWMLSLPACAAAFEASLDHGYTPLTASQIDRFDPHTIVVLGGGIETYRDENRAVTTLSESTALRVLEAARLYDLLEDPRVIASGGGGGGGVSRGGGVPESRAMRRALVELGVPDDRILEESSSTDTRQEALNIRSGFVDQVDGSFILVTSPTHMRRAMGAFRAVGLQPIASPSGEIPAASPAGLRRLLPSLDSLSASTFTIREYMALGYYALRGWTKAR